MRNIYWFILFVFALSIVTSCSQRKNPVDYRLTNSERMICDSLQIDTTIIKDIRSQYTEEIEPFHYSLGKTIEGDKEIEADPIHQKGLRLNVENDKSYQLVLALKENLLKKGYSIFLLENNFNIDGKLDHVGILKTTDKYEVLKQVGTDGINFDITNDSLISLIRKLDEKYSLDLIGASGDWCEFVMHNEPKDWAEFGNEIYKICPDVVDQGTGSPENLVEEIKRTKRLYLWWD